MYSVNLSSVKKGDFFRLVNSDSAPLWIRFDFERSLKKYSCISYDDFCHEIFRKGSTKVFVESI